MSRSARRGSRRASDAAPPAPGGVPSFDEVFASLGRLVRESFPDAQAAAEHGMKGWRIPRRGKPRPDEPKGTIDPRFIHVFLVARKAGITLHFWDPEDFDGLQRRKPELEAAGFKVMRGCLQFNRKQPFPLDVVAALLAPIRDRERGAR